MEEDWAPILIKDDCLFSAVACGSSAQDYFFGNGETEVPSELFSPVGAQHILDTLSSRELADFGFHLGVDGSQNTPGMLLENYSVSSAEFPNVTTVKAEPRDDGATSDYTTSLSQSQSCSPCSSSLSSPDQDNRETIADIQYVPATKNVFAPSLTVNGSFSPRTDARGQTILRARELHTLPPVSHFSQTVTINNNQQNFDSSSFSERIDSPSPPSSDRSSPMEPAVHLGPNTFKTRSKMHEMAVKQHLITDQDPRGSGYVQLSAEEKRTLIQEGYSLPTRLPLSKSEEEALKIVRRKIKNKLSAQESRRKRKEYMDTLEQRVQGYFNENTSLKLKIKQLEQSNRNLIMQLKKMQAALGAQNCNQPPPCLPAQLPVPTYAPKQ